MDGNVGQSGVIALAIRQGLRSRIVPSQKTRGLRIHRTNGGIIDRVSGRYRVVREEAVVQDTGAGGLARRTGCARFRGIQ